MDTIRELVLQCSDKVVINSAAYLNESLIREGAEMFGKQCIVVGIDVRKNNGDYLVYRNSGRIRCNVSLIDHIRRVEALGAGELFINNISKAFTLINLRKNFYIHSPLSPL